MLLFSAKFRPDMPLTLMQVWAFTLLSFLFVPFAYAQDAGIHSGPNGISIHFAERPLEDVLREVQKKSGIKFSLSDRVKTETISVDIQAPDWTAAVKKLLEGYGTIEMGSERGQPSSIFVLATGEQSPFPEQQIHSTVEKTKTPSDPEEKKPVLRRKPQPFVP
jgi:type II secretory pathway component GspD/PulD (secretin)